jgi:hypothetical protein
MASTRSSLKGWNKTTLTNQNSIQEEITEEQTEVRECFPSFVAESIVFQFAVSKYKD